MIAMNPALILASTSKYRRELLERLRLPFSVIAPGVDECALQGEAPGVLASRLAMDKALAVSKLHPRSVVIGSDQVVNFKGESLGKPGTHERALEQLGRLQGQEVYFETAVAVVCLEGGYQAHELVRVRVQFRALSNEEIQRYLIAETPYDCAGSAKSEGLGIALTQAIDSSDPTALIGLPLIATTRLLRRAGIQII